MNYYYVFGKHYLEAESYPWRQLWSLSVEEHFYIFFPGMLLFLARTRRSRLNLIWALIILPFIWRFITYLLLDLPWQYNYVATDTRVDSIAWGCLLAVVLRNDDAQPRDINDLWFIKRWMVPLSLALIAASLLYRDEDFRWTWRFPLQGIAIFLFIANILFDDYWKKFVFILELEPIRFFGRISYGMYLYHMLINKVLILNFPKIPTFQFMLISVFSAFAVATLSYLVLEVPLKSLRRRLGSRVR